MALDSPGRPRMDPGSPRRPWVVARRLRPAPDDHLDGHLDDDLDDHLGEHLGEHLDDHLDDRLDDHLDARLAGRPLDDHLEKVNTMC